MYIQREIEKELIKLIENYQKPICILGARQVGKSTVVKHAVQNYDSVYINMFDTQGINEIFNEDNDISVDRIVSSLELVAMKAITTDTILIFDEIQSNPSALASLKSFKEDGRYKVIGLGSNLGSFLLTKSKYSFPVGQYTRLNMYPINFAEYLEATNNSFLKERLISQLRVGKIDELLHTKLLVLFDEYMAIGGMPEAVKSYLMNSSIEEVDQVKADLVDGYLADFGKYEYAIDNTKALNVIYRSIPLFLNKDNQKFIFSEVNYEYKQLTKSFKWLNDNNYAVLTPQINSLSKPLIANVKESSFKLFANETSLLIKQANYNPFTVIKEQDKIYYGFVMENYIATVLNKYNEVYTYRKAKTEVDFICEKDNRIYAYEVKSGTNTKSKSLNALMAKNEDLISIKLTRDNLRIDNVSIIPLYAIDIILNQKILDQLIEKKVSQ
ncbi:AAA family ATPase [Mollicutes bacterium LVI A0078]|nr:AAA family ATPase [Mollicutes bacterium LVI A0075]WOO91682.1 AAA family ATPase [Mollicutes bacterium LVI A0078]